MTSDDQRYGAPHHVLWSPVRCFRARLAGRPRWLGAGLPVVLGAGLNGAAAAIVAHTGQAAIRPALARAGLAAAPPEGAAEAVGALTGVTVAGVVFGMTALAAVALDQIFAQSGRARRLVELTGVAYLSQLPLAVLALVAALAWQPPPFQVPPSAATAELPGLLRAYQDALASTPMQSTLRLVGAYFGIWLVALVAVALRIVSGFSVAGTWAAGVALGLVFVGAPVAWRLLG